MAERKYGGRGADEEEDFIPQKASITLSRQIDADLTEVMRASSVTNRSWFIRRLLREALSRYRAAPRDFDVIKKTVTVNLTPELVQALNLIASRLGQGADGIALLALRHGLQKLVGEAKEASRIDQGLLEGAKAAFPLLLEDRPPDGPLGPPRGKPPKERPPR